MNEKYLSVLKRLYQTNRFKQKKVNLNNLLKATTFFSSPQNNMNFIHVTGTNGKGSVCKKLAKTFQASGYKTGLYTSPHISSFRERMQINNKLIEKEFVSDELENIFEILDLKDVELTYFEIVTLLSLIYFKNNNIDIGIIEVGLGGNLDATNIIDPLVSVITSIGLDHTDSLGFTQDEIAEKKAGIIKKNRPVVLGPDCYPIEVFLNKSKENESEVFMVDYSNSNKISLDFENENNEIVKKVVEVVNNKYGNLFNVSHESVLIGLKSKQPCRKEDVYESVGKDVIKAKVKELFEKHHEALKSNYTEDQLEHFQKKIDSNCPLKIYLDVGHNPHGLEKLFNSLKNEFPGGNIKSVCGFSSHKDIGENIKTIASFSQKIYLISPKHPRAMPYEELRSVIHDTMHNFVCEKSLIYENEWTKGKVSLNVLCSFIDSVLSDQQEIIVICGSFFLMSEARNSLGYLEDRDPIELNEFDGSVKFGI